MTHALAQAQRGASGPVILAREPWTAFWPEAEALMRVHRAEVDPEGVARAPFSINTELGQMLSDAGAMPIWTARAQGSIVAYLVWNLGPSLDSQSLLATQGPWFVAPDWRASSIGIRLYKRALSDLREMGVERALLHHWTLGGGERLGKFFERLGGTPLEVTYSLWLNE